MTSPTPRSRSRRLAPWLFLGVVALTSGPTAVHAQFIYSGRYVGGGAGDSVTSYYNSQVALSHARLNNAWAYHTQQFAIKQRIRNVVSAKNASWEMKTIDEAEKLKRKVSQMQQLRLIKSRKLERYLENPDASEGSILNGDALNLMLDRLAVTVFTYKFDENGSPSDMQFQNWDQEDIKLSDDILDRLQIVQNLGGGRKTVFRPTDGAAMKVDVWPILLQSAGFDDLRAKFMATRQKAITEAKTGNGQGVTRKTRTELEESLAEMEQELEERYDNKNFRIYQGIDNNLDYLHSEAFLKELKGQLRRINQLGQRSNEMFNGSFAFAGERTLPEFVRYMADSGLKFAPATPGDEPAYNKMYRIMRDFYVTVQDQDRYIVHWEDLTGHLSAEKRLAEANRWRDRGRHNKLEP
ncbi:hypothetical protein [Thalassoroseus pseudoceratinae]|uniref:hypothetical protein n=1 Tax=Thalassoroseus pseudoceratinae TaxID=2713176 RepID=UPI00141ED2AB|nr:hypothetical protein [Thalassoroseus pseudoceratinae]